MKKLLPFFIVVVAITLLAGCPMELETDVSPLVGTWTYQSPSDVTVTGTITFTDTTYKHLDNGVPLVACNYTVNGNEITLSNCKGPEVMRWHGVKLGYYFIDGNTLVIGTAYTRQDDPTEGRSPLVGTWTHVFTTDLTGHTDITITLTFTDTIYTGTYTQTYSDYVVDTYTVMCDYTDNEYSYTLSNCDTGNNTDSTVRYAIRGNTLVIGIAYIRQ
ncbi:MAG: hypothetical protein ACR2PY_09645 [Salinispira sp.]